MFSRHLARSLFPLAAAVLLAAAVALIVLTIGMGPSGERACNNSERIWQTAGAPFLASLIVALICMRYRSRRSELFAAAAVFAVAGLFALTIGADWTDCRTVS
jgi:hypothetical protein